MGNAWPQAAALESVVRGMQRIAVAVSGGVDSLTLAAFVHRLMPERAQMFHAVSPAVQDEGTRRTHELAAREGWALRVIDAAEFDNQDYLRNPANRCYFCKTSLYGAIRPHTSAQIVSGTNLDDLGEYRPGLIAAREHGVRHPFVEAGMSKQQVRALARELGLGEVAELPASPCLSSRVETGIAIQPEVLHNIHTVERMVEQALAPRTVRCRVRNAGIVVELDETSLQGLDDAFRTTLMGRVQDVFAGTHPGATVRFEPYRTGSAFLHFKPAVR
jgi:uncharacterized protein